MLGLFGVIDNDSVPYRHGPEQRKAPKHHDAGLTWPRCLLNLVLYPGAVGQLALSCRRRIINVGVFSTGNDAIRVVFYDTENPILVAPTLCVEHRSTVVIFSSADRA